MVGTYIIRKNKILQGTRARHTQYEINGTSLNNLEQGTRHVMSAPRYPRALNSSRYVTGKF